MRIAFRPERCGVVQRSDKGRAHLPERVMTAAHARAAIASLFLAVVPFVSTADAKCIYSNPDAPLTLPGAKPPVGAEPPAPVVAAPSTPAIPERSSVLNPGFAYHPPGNLLPQDKGRGRVGDRKVYVPDMIFPVKLQPGAEAAPPGRHAFMNSQIWNLGGYGYGNLKGPGGSECSAANYDAMLQRDNFCEVRSWTMSMCPSGQGHQGQDIRPPECKGNKWPVVAALDGIITKVSASPVVTLKADDGTVFEYLHMHPSSIKVSQGDRVKRGQELGKISNYHSGSPNQTTNHLHLNIQQTITINGVSQRVYIPPYTSLIAAYRAEKGLDRGIDPNGNLIIDPLLEIGAQAEKDAPPILSWAIPNVTGNDGRLLSSIALSKYFRPRASGTKLRYASVGLPQGIQLNPETGEIRGNFDRGASRGGVNGAYTVTVMAEDPTGNKAQQSFVLTALYSPPAIGTATRGKFFKDGSRVLIDAGAAFVSYSDTALTFSATGLPSGISITPATGRISGRLTKTASKDGDDGVYTVTVTAADSKSKVTHKFTITAEPQKDAGAVVPALPPPVVVSALPTVKTFAGEMITPIDTASGFATYGYERVRYTAASLPVGLDIDPDTGRISGTPSADALKGGDNGSYTVKIIADNGEGGTASQSFVMTIQNRAPVVVIPTINKIYKEGETVVVPVAAAFSAPDMSILTYTVSGLPNGVRYDPETGRVVGKIADGASQARPGGVYSVTATADDGRGGRVSQTFAVTIEAEKAPPVVVGPIPATAVIEGTTFEVVRSATAFKVGVVGNVLMYSAEGLPPGLSINDTTGEISGSAVVGTTGAAATKPFDVKITATDPRVKLSASQNTTIVVVQAPKPAPPPEPAKPEPKPEPVKTEPSPEPAQPSAPPATEPAKPEPTPEPAKPEPSPEPAKPTTPEQPKTEPAPVVVPEPPKPEPPKAEPPQPESQKPEATPEPAPVEPSKPVDAPKQPTPAPEQPKKDTWSSWAYGYAKGAWDWAAGYWKKK